MRRLFSRGGRPQKLRPLRNTLAAAVITCSILSCDSKPQISPQPRDPVPAAMHAPLKIEWKKEPLPPLEDDKPMKGPLCSDNMCKLAREGKRYRRLADIISFRTRDYRSNRLTYDEANRAAGYVLSDISSMRNCRRLIRFLPETAVEILRGVHERGVDRKEAEKMAYYLYRFISWVGMRKRKSFDEYLAHIVGRDWNQIEYPVEGMTWQGQKKFYGQHDVPDLKTALHIHRYLKTERSRAHFKNIFHPRGRMPPAPK